MSALFSLLTDLLPALWWPFCRFIATLATMPFTGEAITPMWARILIALVLAIVALPAIPHPPPIDPFSLHGIAVTVEQVIIGLVFGMAFQLMMSVLSTLGFLLSSQMGFSMAVMNDPSNSDTSDVISNLFYLFGAMLFFAIDGHLVLIEIVYSSFMMWPIGAGIDILSLNIISSHISWMLSAAILLALPAVLATFIVQIGIGLINRAAPSLNLFSLSFPMITLFGLGTLGLVMRFLPEYYLRLTSQVLQMMNEMMGSATHG